MKVCFVVQFVKFRTHVVGTEQLLRVFIQRFMKAKVCFQRVGSSQFLCITPYYAVVEMDFNYICSGLMGCDYKREIEGIKLNLKFQCRNGHQKAQC